MPHMFDPKTGKTYDVPDDEVATAQEQHGLQTEDQVTSAAATGGAASTVIAGGVGLERSLASLLSFGSYDEATGKPRTAKEIIPGAFTAEASALAEAHPTAAGLGGAVPAVAASFALPGSGVAGIASALGLAGVDAAVQENLNAELEGGRPFDAGKFLSTAGIDLALQGAGHGLGKALGAGFRGAKSVGTSLTGRFQSALARGGGEAEAVAAQKTLADTVKGAAEEILSAPVPKIASNPVAQKSAIEDLAIALGDGDPGIARAIREASVGTGGQRYKALRAIADTASDRQAAAISDVLEQESLWGQKAVQHAKATEAVKAAMPEVDDVADSVSQAQAHGIMRKEGERVKDLRSALNGGARSEKGLLQGWSDAMQVVGNTEKRADFGAMWAELPDATRASGSATLRELAQGAESVAEALEAMKGKRQAEKLRGFIRDAVEEGTPSTADALKNALQRHRVALASQAATDVGARDLKAIVDEFEQPLRAALQDSEIVGDRIAELQRTRNQLWSDPERGFIRNQARLKAAGFDLFNVVERGDYEGKMLLQVDRRAVDSLIASPQHIAQPALEALEDMARSTKGMADDLMRLGGQSNRTEANALKKASEGILERVRSTRELHAAREAVGEGGLLKAAVTDAVGSVPLVGGAVKGLVRENVAPRIAEMFGSRRVARKAVDVDSVSRLTDALRSHPAGSVAADKVDGALGRYVMSKGKGGAANSNSAEHLAERWAVQTADAAKGIALPALARRAPRAAAAASAAPLERFIGQDATLSQAYERTRAQIDASHADALGDSTAAQAEGLPAELQLEAARQQTRVLAYIQSVTPQPVGVSVSRPKGRPASYQEMRDYALRVDAATNPEGVFEDAAHGTVKREQLEALQVCWPQRYEELKQQTIVQLGHGSTTTSRQRASLLFNLGSEIDPALGAEVSALAAQARQKQSDDMQGKAATAPTRATPKSMGAVVPAGQAALNLGSQLAMGAQ